MKSTPSILLITILLNIVLYCQEKPDSTEAALESLLEQGVQRNEYVQSASKYSQTTYESPYTLDLVSRKEIESYGYTKLSEVLLSLGGIYLSCDLNYEYLGFSGFGVPTDYNSRIQILVDGHQLSDHVYNSSLIDELAFNINNIDRIEMVKGPGSVLYGGNAMFGIINIIPKKTEKTSSLNLNGGFGSFNSKFISGGFSLSNNNDLNFNLSANYSKTDGRDFYFSEFDSPETNNGIVTNLDGEKKYGFYTSLKYKSAEITAMSSFRRKDVPSAPYEVDFGSNSPTIDYFHYFEAKYNHDISFDKQLNIRAYYDHYYFHGSYIYEGMPAWDMDHSKSAGAEFQYLWDISTNNRLIAGAEFNRVLTADYTYWDQNTEYSHFEFTYNKYGIYVQDEFHINEYFAVYSALRYDDFGKTGDKITPRITLVISPNDDNTIKLLWGTSFRLPTLYERYYEDLSSGDKMNPDLKSEDISTFDISWLNRSYTGIKFSAGMFYSIINNFINTRISPEDSLSFYDNYGKINLYGIKLESDFTFNSFAGGYLRYAWQNAEDNNNNKIINSPANLAKAGIYFDYLGLNTSLEYIYESSRLTYSDVKTKDINYAALSLSNSAPLEGIRLALRVNNLFNSVIQYPGGHEHLQPYFTMPGRNFLFTVSYQLQ